MKASDDPIITEMRIFETQKAIARDPSLSPVTTEANIKLPSPPFIAKRAL